MLIMIVRPVKGVGLEVEEHRVFLRVCTAYVADIFHLLSKIFPFNALNKKYSNMKNSPVILVKKGQNIISFATEYFQPSSNEAYCALK